MRISKKLATKVISEVVGNDAIPAINLLYGKQDISEFDVADLYEEDINYARNVLYRMHNNNLVSFMKKKDKTRGWYVYYWTLNPQRVKELAIQVDINRFNNLSKRLEREKGHLYYICCNKCVRFDFEKATDFEFRCPECSSILGEHDNTQTIKNIEQELEKLRPVVEA